MRTTHEVLRELLRKGSEATEQDYEVAMSEFKEVLEDGPIKPLAYAGIAHCKAKLDHHPFTVIDYFTLALSFNTQNEVIWRLLSEYATEQSKRVSMSYPEVSEDNYLLSKGVDRYPARPTESIELDKSIYEPLSEIQPIKVMPMWKRLGIFAGIWGLAFLIIKVFDK